MKTTTLALLLMAALLLGTGTVHSQRPARTETLLQSLEMMKRQNAAVLEKQAKTLETLSAMEKEAQQIKVLSKRT